MASILIVDDDAQFAAQVAGLLQSAGHAVTVESQGEAAVAAALGGAHHLILLDVMLPDLSGFEVCRRIRRDVTAFNLPIVMLSSMSGEEEVLHGLAQGADDYLTKPCDPQNLLQRVTVMLRAASEGNTTDGLTGLASGDQTKRELQRRMVTPDPFALVYVELLAIREFAYQYGHDARCKAIRHLGRAIQKIGEHVLATEPFIGHMGGGHFVCLMDPAKAAEFGEKLRQAWLNHLDSFYANIGQAHSRAVPQKGEEVPPLDVLCCITRRDPKVVNTPKGLFDTVSQIRQRALAARQPGVHVDQREATA